MVLLTFILPLATHLMLWFSVVIWLDIPLVVDLTAIQDAHQVTVNESLHSIVLVPNLIQMVINLDYINSTYCR